MFHVWCPRLQSSPVLIAWWWAVLFRYNTPVWQTGRQTDTARQHTPRYAYASRGNYALTVAYVSVERPLPRLLTSTNESVRVMLPDDGQSFELVRASVISLCYIAADDSFYWIDRTRRLVVANVASNGTLFQVCLISTTMCLVRVFVPLLSVHCSFVDSLLYFYSFLSCGNAKSDGYGSILSDILW